ncbi:MAG: hypothetical protein WA871_02210 [Candidatus Acidiferrales bacterium]
MLKSASHSRALVRKNLVRKEITERRKSAPIAALVGVLVAVLAVMLMDTAPTRAQIQSTGTTSTSGAGSSSRSAAATHSATTTGGGVRVFMSNSASWKQIGGWGLAGQSRGGRGAPADPDGQKAFEKHCSQYPLTNDRDSATYVILLDQLNVKKPVKGRDKITVYNRAGVAVYSNSTRLLDDSIKDACKSIGGDHGKKHR